MFPDRDHVCAFADLMGTFWLPMSSTNKTALAVQLTVLGHDVAIISILDILAGTLEQLHI